MPDYRADSIRKASTPSDLPLSLSAPSGAADNPARSRRGAAARAVAASERTSRDEPWPLPDCMSLRCQVHDVAEHRVVAADLTAADAGEGEARRHSCADIQAEVGERVDHRSGGECAAGRIVLVCPIRKPPRGDDREALVVIDDLVQAPAVAIDQGLRRAEGVLSEREGARSIAIEARHADEHDRQPAKLCEPARLAGQDAAHQLVRQERRQKLVTGERRVGSPAVSASAGASSRPAAGGLTSPMTMWPGSPSTGRPPTCPRRPRLRSAPPRRAGPAPLPLPAPPIGGPPTTQRHSSPTPPTIATHMSPMAIPARARTETPSTGGRASSRRWPSRAQVAADATAAGQVVGGSGPHRDDRVTRETDDVAAPRVDTLDDVAEGLVKHRGERFGAAGTALGEPLGRGP